MSNEIYLTFRVVGSDSDLLNIALPCAPDVGEEIEIHGVNYIIRNRKWGIEGESYDPTTRCKLEVTQCDWG